MSIFLILENHLNISLTNYKCFYFNFLRRVIWTFHCLRSYFEWLNDHRWILFRELFVIISQRESHSGCLTIQNNFSPDITMIFKSYSIDHCTIKGCNSRSIIYHVNNNHRNELFYFGGIVVACMLCIILNMSSNVLKITT